MPAGARDFIFSETSRTALGPTRPPVPGVKQPEREVDDLTPSRGEVTNEWSYTSTSPVCLHGVDRYNFSIAKVYELFL
jgi:hypothetical protein